MSRLDAYVLGIACGAYMTVTTVCTVILLRHVVSIVKVMDAEEFDAEEEGDSEHIHIDDPEAVADVLSFGTPSSAHRHVGM